MPERRNGNGLEAKFQQAMFAFSELTKQPENRGVSPEKLIKSTVESFFEESRLIMPPEATRSLAERASMLDFSSFTSAQMDGLIKYLNSHDIKK